MALNFLKKELNSKKRKAEEMLPASTEKDSKWVTRGDLERERERAYKEEQAKIDRERREVCHNRVRFPLASIPLGFCSCTDSSWFHMGCFL